MVQGRVVGRGRGNLVGSFLVSHWGGGRTCGRERDNCKSRREA